LCVSPGSHACGKLTLRQSSLFASWFSCKSHGPFAWRLLTIIPVGLGGIYWLHLNWGRYFESPRKTSLAIVNALIAGIGATIVSARLANGGRQTDREQCGLGLYVSGKAIHDHSGGKAFTCANTG
jgi:hypothetical protein